MENTEQKEPGYGLLMVAIVTGAFLMTLASSTINIAVPYLMEHFNTGLDTVKWAMTGFMLSTGIIAPVTCYFGERFSYKTTYLISIIGFTLCSLLCALSWNIQSLVAFRILQGAFNGFAVPSTMSIIYQVAPRKKQAMAISLWSLSAMLAPAFGPTISGWIIQNFNWKAIFLMNIPIGIVAIILVVKAVPYYKLNPPAGFDLLGFSACLTASVLILTAFSEAAQWGWTSKETISFFSAGLVLLAVFIFREKHARNPILNFEIFKYKGFTISVIIRSVITMGLYAGSLLTPLFLQNAQHISALDAGLVLLPPSLAMALCMLVVGRLYNRVDPRIFVVGGIISMAAGSYLLSQLSLESSHIYIIMCMTLRNVGIAFATAPVTNLGMSSLDRKLAGNGSAVNNWVAQSIGCLSIGIFTSLLSFLAKQHAVDLSQADTAVHMSKVLLNDKAFVMGINDVYFISVIIVLIAIPLCFLFKREAGDGGKQIAANSGFKPAVVVDNTESL
ncbi:putative multidrug resistance protein EmrY [Ruminiclostridium hungatei]|uniref:Putative multidrug resistance protein EmrY n=1 Tax=Ruminiclostridium hungatei TaxID=48256 RepID=A0A1V4SFZ0_RUMHU|nr:MDR family MFS transporter [Ruminiclostridium hungatei]OPX42653.1 putative multidrug resistance protein EmrY [Ruminiclostridium hungatei]